MERYGLYGSEGEEQCSNIPDNTFQIIGGISERRVRGVGFHSAAIWGPGGGVLLSNSENLSP